MLTSICPLGERARRQRYGLTVAAYVVSSALAAIALGALLGGAGRVVLSAAGPVASAVSVWLVAVAAAAGVAADLRWRGRHLPGPARQVNENWLSTYRGWVYGGGFGAQLGLGVSTFVVASAVYVVLVGAFASGSMLAGALIGAVFGTARAVPVLLTADVRDHLALRARMNALQQQLPTVRRTLLVTQAAVALCAALVAVAGQA